LELSLVVAEVFLGLDGGHVGIDENAHLNPILG
jgi:hypothetical protein